MQPPGTSAGAVPNASAVPGPAPSGGLQATITSRRRSVAVIDGEVVPLGGKVGESRLEGVSEGSVVLKKDGEKEVRRMLPEGYKQRSARVRASRDAEKAPK